jgi:hypothetical protein
LAVWRASDWESMAYLAGAGVNPLNACGRSAVLTAAFDAVGHTLAVGGDDGLLRVWEPVVPDGTSWRVAALLKGHTAAVLCTVLDFQHNGVLVDACRITLLLVRRQHACDMHLGRPRSCGVHHAFFATLKAVRLDQRVMSRRYQWMVP